VIPREDLLLEHVLGEGEFGRVLKGLLRSVTGSIYMFIHHIINLHKTMRLTIL